MAYKFREDRRQREFERASRKRRIVDHYKQMKGCCDCGYKEHSAALEFDHTNSLEKTCTVASLMYNSMARIKREIDKCVVRCANCYQIKSVDEQRNV
jgi:hypothetical protein